MEMEVLAELVAISTYIHRWRVWIEWGIPFLARPVEFAMQIPKRVTNELLLSTGEWQGKNMLERRD